MKEDELEARIDKLEAKIKRSQDILEIMNLQARYSFYLEHGYNMRIADELFVQKDPQVKCDHLGIFVGIESIRRKWVEMDKMTPPRGFFGPVLMTTPCIEISKDGKTAKGMWRGWAPNTLTGTPYPCDHNHQDTMTAIWLIVTYNHVFAKEDGKWKYLSFNLTQIFWAPYEHGWVKNPVGRMGQSGRPLDLQPDLPLSYYKPYHPHAFNVLPELPGPMD